MSLLARHMAKVCYAGSVLLLLALASVPAEAGCNHPAPPRPGTGAGVLADPLVLLDTWEKNVQTRPASRPDPAPVPCFRCGSNSPDGVPATVPPFQPNAELLSGEVPANDSPSWQFLPLASPDQYQLHVPYRLERPPRPI
jgi:hypothetical protein